MSHTPYEAVTWFMSLKPERQCGYADWLDPDPPTHQPTEGQFALDIPDPVDEQFALDVSDTEGGSNDARIRRRN